MSNWCEKCMRTPYVGCDDKCPVFGLDFEELAERYLTLLNVNEVPDNTELLPDDCLYINGFLCRDHNGILSVADSDDGYACSGMSIIDAIENYAELNGLFGRTQKGLGGRQSLIENCNMRVYFTEKECSLYAAQIAFEEHMYGGDLKTKVSLVGYSEWTITGLNLDEFTIGGHDLEKELGNHIGEYIHMIIEC